MRIMSENKPQFDHVAEQAAGQPEMRESQWRECNLNGIQFRLSPRGNEVLVVDDNSIASADGQYVPKGSTIGRREAIIPADGRFFRIALDAWGDSLLMERVSSNTESNEKFLQTKQQVLAIWEQATDVNLSNEDFEKRIAASLGPEGERILRMTNDLLDVLEQYPVLLDDAWAQSTDLRIIADQTNPEEEIEKRLLGRPDDANSYAPTSDLCDSPVYPMMLGIVKKLTDGEALADEEQKLIAAMSIARTSGDPQRGFELIINDVTKKYATARVLENRLVKQYVGFDIFEEHQHHYDNFSRILRAAGCEIPKYFQPYLGTEFSWSLGTDSRYANAGGHFFLHPELDGRTIASVLDHERVHNVSSVASDIGYRKYVNQHDNAIDSPVEQYNECFTESFSQLIQAEGNCQIALKTNEKSNISYSTGVAVLLGIIAELEQKSGSPAAVLLVQCLQLVSKGAYSTYTGHLQHLYDEANGQGSFDERMEKYANRRMTKFQSEEDQQAEELPPPTPQIDQFLFSFKAMTFTQIAEKFHSYPEIFDEEMHERYWAKTIEEIMQHKELLFSPHSPSEWKDEAKTKILNDPEMHREINQLLAWNMRIDNVIAIKRFYDD